MSLCKDCFNQTMYSKDGLKERRSMLDYLEGNVNIATLNLLNLTTLSLTFTILTLIQRSTAGLNLDYSLIVRY